MKSERLTIRTNARLIAETVLLPEDKRERAKGMRGRKRSSGVAMLWIFPDDRMRLVNMLWVFEPLGFIALDSEKRIVDLGVLKPWISFKLIQCHYLIETVPEAVSSLKKGDQVRIE